MTVGATLIETAHLKPLEGSHFSRFQRILFSVLPLPRMYPDFACFGYFVSDSKWVLSLVYESFRNFVFDFFFFCLVRGKMVRVEIETLGDKLLR